MNRRPIQSVLLDLDGTLVNSVPDLTHAVNITMRYLSLPDYSEEQVQTWVGSGTERLVSQALTNACKTGLSNDTFDRAYPVFLKAYEEGICERSHLYPGVRAGLVYLKEAGYRLGCVTNKPERLAESLLRNLGILTFFSVVVGGDSLPQKKPDPAVLEHAASRLDTSTRACLMIGDSKHDVSAARAAGMEIVCVTYGYNRGRDIRESNPDAVIDSLTDIRDLLTSEAVE
ncbi:MAG: phosphoglycolate phosphatase [Arenicellales bacterium]|nr:phosphoglycolate phosphatase [Arenicellales bacterium]